MRWLLVFVFFGPAFLLSAAESPHAALDRLPKVIADCERGKIQIYTDAKKGASLSFSQPGLLLAVFAVDSGQPDLPDGNEGKAAREAYEQAMSELKEAEKKGAYKDVEERDKGTVKIAEGKNALRARYRLTRLNRDNDGKRFVSEIDVFGARGLTIKVRMTGDVESEAAHAKTMEKFLPALFEALTKPPEAKVDPAKAGESKPGESKAPEKKSESKPAEPKPAEPEKTEVEPAAPTTPEPKPEEPKPDEPKGEVLLAKPRSSVAGL